MALFVHQPLTIPTSEVRLIILLPGSNGPLRCHLITTTLSAAPAYEAISYSWGDPTPTHELWIGDQRYPIATSQFQGLSTIRQPHYSRILWIDGICISQGDNPVDLEEKSQQILLMRQIFHQAGTVLIYLGAQADGSETLPRLFQTVLTRFEAAQQAGLRLSREVNNAQDFRIPRSRLQELGFPAQTDPSWRALSYFLSRSWFRRVWVIQEITLSRKATIICGAWQLPWQRWAVVLEAVLTYDLPWNSGEDNRSTVNQDSVEMVKTMTSLRECVDTDIYWSSLDILHRARPADATNGRDKVYGLLGLSQHFGETTPLPDYGKPQNNIFQEWARSFVQKRQGIRVLYAACNADRSMNLPSWVPDWTQRPSARPALAPHGTLVQSGRALAYDASSGTESFINLSTSNQDELTIKGRFVDVVQHTGIVVSYVRAMASPFDRFGPLAVCIQEIEQMLISVNPRGQLEARDNIVWRTVLCNRAFNSNAPPLDNYADIYDNFLKIRATVVRDIPRRPEWENMGTSEDDLRSVLEDAQIFAQHAYVFCTTRKRCLTRDGLVGQFPKSTLTGDRVFIPHGSAVPFVLRKTAGGRYTLVGECYVHGIMNGERFTSNDHNDDFVHLV